MTIKSDLILEWIERTAHVQGVSMDPDALADDVFLMAYVFSEEAAFLQAMNHVVQALHMLVAGKVQASQLEKNLSGWDSYHFQSKRVQGQRADLRIIFQRTADDTLYVKGFGHRFLPADIYKRLRPRS